MRLFGKMKWTVLAIIVVGLICFTKLAPNRTVTLREHTETEGIRPSNVKCSFSEDGIAEQNGVTVNYESDFIEVNLVGKKSGNTEVEITKEISNSRDNAKTQETIVIAKHNVKVNAFHGITVE